MKRYHARLDKLETAAPSTQPKNIILIAPDANVTALESQHGRFYREPNEEEQAFIDRVVKPFTKGVTLWSA